jgi:hypothetical protein
MTGKKTRTQVIDRVAALARAAVKLKNGKEKSVAHLESSQR